MMRISSFLMSLRSSSSENSDPFSPKRGTTSSWAVTCNFSLESAFVAMDVAVGWREDMLASSWSRRYNGGEAIYALPLTYVIANVHGEAVT